MTPLLQEVVGGPGPSISGLLLLSTWWTTVSALSNQQKKRKGKGFRVALARAWKTFFFLYIYSSASHNSGKVGATQVSIDG